jgi:hypothetical protein
MIIYNAFADPRHALELVKHGVREYFCSFVAVAPALEMMTVCKGLKEPIDVPSKIGLRLIFLV